MNDEFKTERLVVLIEPSRRKQIEELAKEPEFLVNGQPSSAAVVRAALDLFFGEYGHIFDHSFINQNAVNEVA